MYTKEDKGTNLYLPYYGDAPCPMVAFDQGEVYQVEVMTPEGRTLRYASNGKANVQNHNPVLSRTPYIQGEPFVCVVERPEPEPNELWNRIYSAVAGGHDLPDMESEQVTAITANVYKYAYDRFCNLSGEPEPLTFDDLELKDRVKNKDGKQGRIHQIGMDINHVQVQYDENGDYEWFGENRKLPISNLTKLPTPKPFGPEDDGITVWDQFKQAWECNVEYGPEGEFLNAWIYDNTQVKVINIPVYPDGTTATALRFSRTKPEQC